MVLSNKKLKQKLRAAKAELIAAAEAQNNMNGKDFDKFGSVDSKESLPLKILMDKEGKRAKVSKREKRRQNAEHSAEGVKQKQIVGSVDEKIGVELEQSDVDKKKKKKRKRDEAETLEKVKEEKPEQPKKKKKTKNKRKPKKNSEKKQAKEEVQQQDGGQTSGEQLMVEACPSNDNVKELEPSTKVYVGGIPYYSTEDDIRSYFESCGSITDVDCMEFPDTGKFRGIAIITFKTEAAAKRALARDGSDMGGLFLKIQPFKSARVASKLSTFSPVAVEGYNRIYVGNLSWDVTEDDMKKLFSDCTISSIRFGEDKETGEFKGYAHIDFVDNLSLNMALKLDQSIVFGRRVRISCAVPKKGNVSKLKSTPLENHVGGDKVRAVSKDRDISSVKVSAFNKNQDVNSADVSTVSKVQENYSTKVSAVKKDLVNSSMKVTSKGEENNGEVIAASSKTRRRTCYECGEKGHISSLCPKKQATNLANPSGGNVSAVSEDQENYGTKVCADSKDQINSSYTVNTESKSQENSTEVTAVSSKIRRRTCYECGEKGHISSLCPKKQAAELANPSAA